MNAPSFWRGAGIGLVLSGIGAIGYSAFAPMLGAGVVLRAVSVLIAAVLVAVQMGESGARIGRLVVALALVATASVLVLFDPPLSLWLVVLTMQVWLVRSLYRYRTLGSALLDAGLSAIALAAAIASARHSHSVFLALWSYCLVQALSALIGTAREETAAVPEDDFGQAHRVAESALRRLAARA